MKKISKIFTFVLMTFPLASCGGVSSSLIIKANSTDYTIGISNPVRITIDNQETEGVSETDLENISYSVQPAVSEDEWYVDNEVGIFKPETPGNYKISATAGETISNILSINAHFEQTDANDIKQKIQAVLLEDMVLGKAYDIGLNKSSVREYVIEGSDGIIRFDENGYLEVCGIGYGRITVKKTNGTVVLENARYIVYNSILVTTIREKLISLAIIEEDDNITNQMLDYITDISLAGFIVNDTNSAYGVKYLNNLENLDLSRNNLTDLSFISNLKKLKSINLDSNYISDLSPITENEDLNYISLKDNQISDGKHLKYFKKLEFLDLSNNVINDISFVSGLTKLKSLLLNNNSLTVYKDPLSSLKKLQELGVGFCGISYTDLLSLSFLNSLTYLDISGTDPSLSNLVQMSSLKSLILSDCNLAEKNIADLNGLTNLQELDVSENGLTMPEIDKLDGDALANLKILRIGGNSFDAIPDLSKYTITTLDLTNSYNLESLDNINVLTVKHLIIDECNSLSGVNYINSINRLTMLEDLSIIGAFTYLNKSLFAEITNKVKTSNLKLRFLEGQYCDKDTISYYSKNIFFSYDEFLDAFICENKDIEIYTFGKVGSKKGTQKHIDVTANASRHLILALMGDTGSTQSESIIVDLDKTISRFDIYANKYMSYNMSFNISFRNESSLTLGFSNFKTIGNIVSADGSKLVAKPLSGQNSVTGKDGVVVRESMSNPNRRIESYAQDAINGYDVFIVDGSGTLSLTGGNGGKGPGNTDEKEGSKGNHGFRGGQGGNGVYCRSFTNKCKTLSVRGGNGGKGGSGYFQFAYEDSTSGSGGNGGHGVSYSDTYSTKYTINASGGIGGARGIVECFTGNYYRSDTSDGNNGSSTYKRK